jgi:hypothetical protein
MVAVFSFVQQTVWTSIVIMFTYELLEGTISTVYAGAADCL